MSGFKWLLGILILVFLSTPLIAKPLLDAPDPETSSIEDRLAYYHLYEKNGAVGFFFNLFIPGITHLVYSEDYLPGGIWLSSAAIAWGIAIISNVVEDEYGDVGRPPAFWVAMIIAVVIHAGSAVDGMFATIRYNKRLNAKLQLPENYIVSPTLSNQTIALLHTSALREVTLSKGIMTPLFAWRF
jgi:hypothetical protein